MHQFARIDFANPLTFEPRASEPIERASDASLRALHLDAAHHLLRVARQRLRECEKASTNHLGEGEMSPWADKIANAEREVSEARALVNSLQADHRLAEHAKH